MLPPASQPSGPWGVALAVLLREGPLGAARPGAPLTQGSTPSLGFPIAHVLSMFSGANSHLPKVIACSPEAESTWSSTCLPLSLPYLTHVYERELH